MTFSLPHFFPLSTTFKRFFPLFPIHVKQKKELFATPYLQVIHPAEIVGHARRGF